MSFIAKGNLKTHLKIQTSERSFMYKVYYTGEKHFKCKVYDMSFSGNNSLKTHTITHTGKKPFV